MQNKLRWFCKTNNFCLVITLIVICGSLTFSKFGQRTKFVTLVRWGVPKEYLTWGVIRSRTATGYNLFMSWTDLDGPYSTCFPTKLPQKLFIGQIDPGNQQKMGLDF